MPRIRTIKPEFFSHEGLASKSAYARLLAIGLLTLADCKGRLRWVPMQVHAAVFPWEAPGEKFGNIDELLGELVDASYLVHYEADGKRYVEIVNFNKHQRLSGKEASYESLIPPPPKNPAKTLANPGENSGASQGSVGNPLGTGEQGNRGTGELLSLKSEKSKIEIPPEIADAWQQWSDFREAIDGRPIPETAIQTHLMDLGRRGYAKAKRDIEFSILKDAKSILDSDNDYQKPKRSQSRQPEPPKANPAKPLRRYAEPNHDQQRAEQ